MIRTDIEAVISVDERAWYGREGGELSLTDFPKASVVMMLLVATVKSSDRSIGFLL